MTPSKFFSEKEKKLITDAIKKAEKNSSGEIRVHIENKCPGNVMDRAAYIFEKLKMHKTILRNGVLFYLATGDRKSAILGDAGINMKTADDFWESTENKMLEKFREGNYAEGLAEAIKTAGYQLKEHFPYEEDDLNELPDDISFGND